MLKYAYDASAGSGCTGYALAGAEWLVAVEVLGAQTCSMVIEELGSGHPRRRKRTRSTAFAGVGARRLL